MYLYETHLHTSPVSRCARCSVTENLEFYRKKGYTGVFITNHFIDGNSNTCHDLSYEEKINFYFSDYEEALSRAKEVGIDVFLGVEMSYHGTDFLVYGLDKEWFLQHPEIMDMKKSDELAFLRDAGALIIHAHPFREANYIDHIRLFPRLVEGVETVNACRTEFENKMADLYATEYGLLKVAGGDNHVAGAAKRLAGLAFSTPLQNEADFISRVRAGAFSIFAQDNI